MNKCDNCNINNVHKDFETLSNYEIITKVNDKIKYTNKYKNNAFCSQYCKNDFDKNKICNKCKCLSSLKSFDGHVLCTLRQSRFSCLKKYINIKYHMCDLCDDKINFNVCKPINDLNTLIINKFIICDECLKISPSSIEICDDNEKYYNSKKYKMHMSLYEHSCYECHCICDNNEVLISHDDNNFYICNDCININ